MLTFQYQMKVSWFIIAFPIIENQINCCIFYMLHHFTSYLVLSLRWIRNTLIKLSTSVLKKNMGYQTSKRMLIIANTTKVYPGWYITRANKMLRSLYSHCIAMVPSFQIRLSIVQFLPRSRRITHDPIWVASICSNAFPSCSCCDNLTSTFFWSTGANFIVLLLLRSGPDLLPVTMNFFHFPLFIQQFVCLNSIFSWLNHKSCWLIPKFWWLKVKTMFFILKSQWCLNHNCWWWMLNFWWLDIRRSNVLHP